MVAYLQRRHYTPVGPAAARLPPARPARSGHRALPLSRRSSRSITRELLDAACASYFVDGGRAHAAGVPRRSRRARGRARWPHRRCTDATAPSRSPVATDLLARARSARCSRCCRSTSSRDFLRTGHVTGLLLLVERVAGRRADDRAAPRAIVDRSVAARGRDDRVARRAAAAARRRAARRSPPIAVTALVSGARPRARRASAR